MKYDRNSTLGEIISDPIAAEALEELSPGFQSHPMIHHAMNMTLEDIAAFPGAGVSSEQIDEMLDALRERLGD